jgi:hypothetical protein
VKLAVLTFALAGTGCGDVDLGDATSSQDGSDVPTASVQQELVPTCAPGVPLVCVQPPPGSGVKITCYCQPQPIQRGSLVPEYFVTHVVYSPPGRTSSVTYSSATSMGTTTSVSSGFKTDVKVTAEASGTFGWGSGGGSISAGVSTSTNKTDASEVSVTVSQGHRTPGQSDLIDHNYDEIHLLLRPKVDLSYQAPALAGEKAKISWKFGQQDGVNYGIPYMVYAGWLNNSIAMPSSVRDLLAFYGITSDKYAKILAENPLYTGTFPNMTMDPERYQLIDVYPYTPLPQGAQSNTRMYSIDQRNTTSTSSTSDRSYSVGLAANAGADFGVVKAKLNLSSSWTWTNSSTVRTSNGQANMDSLSLGQPSFGYNGPTLVRVYVDKVYHTYAFTQDYPQGETNLALGRPSHQSSELLGYGANASKVNDGNTNGDFWAGSVNHSEAGFTWGFPGAIGQWWYVDLGSERVVNTVKIFNRTDCCTERLGGYQIFAWDNEIGWKVISDHSADTTSGVGFINSPIDMVRTQYVGVAKMDDNYLHLAEVQVLGF